MDAFNEIIARLEKQKEAIDKALGALREIDEAPPAPVAPVKRSYTRAKLQKRSGPGESARKAESGWPMP